MNLVGVNGSFNGSSMDPFLVGDSRRIARDHPKSCTGGRRSRGRRLESLMIMLGVARKKGQGSAIDFASFLGFWCKFFAVENWH